MSFVYLYSPVLRMLANGWSQNSAYILKIQKIKQK